MSETILFCVVFLSQILLISWFYPRRVISGRRYVLQNFPPATHPRLYPQPIDYYERRLRHFARLNLAIVIMGLLIIVALIIGMLGGKWDGRIVTPWSSSGEWDAAIVTPFFLLQNFALVYLELASLEHHRAMKTAPPPRVRTTELHRRRLVDFVSPAMLVVAVLTYAVFVVFILAYRRYEFAWFTASGNIAIVTFMLLMFCALIGVVLRGRKLNPYQANKDRRHSIKLVVQQALGFCIAVPALIMVNLIIKAYDPDYLEPVVASLFCQGAALALLWPLYSYRPDNVDFDVYKRDADLVSASGELDRP